MSARNPWVRQIRRAAVRSFATLLPGVAAMWFENALRILRDREVVKQTVDFLATGRPQADRAHDEITLPAGPDDRSDIVVNAGVVT